jgi:mRNA interferase MazF
MAELMKGDVVVLPFPYSNLSATKKRPAMVVGILEAKMQEVVDGIINILKQ